MSRSKKTKSANALGEVAACDCGGANLTLGPMTLHLSAEDVQLLQELLGAAAAFGDRAIRSEHDDAGLKDRSDLH